MFWHIECAIKGMNSEFLEATNWLTPAVNISFSHNIISVLILEFQPHFGFYEPVSWQGLQLFSNSSNEFLFKRFVLRDKCTTLYLVGTSSTSRGRQAFHFLIYGLIKNRLERLSVPHLNEYPQGCEFHTYFFKQIGMSFWLFSCLNPFPFSSPVGRFD